MRLWAFQTQRQLPRVSKYWPSMRLHIEAKGGCMSQVISDQRRYKRRATDRSLGGLFIVTIVITLVAGLFIGIQIERRIERAREAIVSRNK
jgi:quinol-cytochrome oxidoreductase complex cytochrome b subunit